MHAKSPNIQLGADAWLAFSDTFHQAAADNFITTDADKAQLWFGFMAAAAGEMTGGIGAEHAQALLYAIAKGCGDAAKIALAEHAAERARARPTLTVVKP
ncbi:hypothetical protein [Pseudomonas fluorescens]|uniref:Uncharacterized protein n=1 Tax=Pseudomonas fluorescens TaxID=294 RepID=A0A5E7DXT8_PSEFL|nr:hypothetical protein [Pseudomonas fluorescens]VVO18758.1 hypothetical protein PS691_04016 [Pseudomonas fluorescens]